MKNKIDFRLLNLLLILCVIYIGIKTFNLWSGVVGEIFSILLPFLLAFVIAYSLYPLVRFLEKLGVRKTIATISVILFTFCIVIILSLITIPIIYNELITLSDLLKKVIQGLSSKYNISLNDFELLIESPLNSVITKIGNYISNGMIEVIQTSIEILTKTIVTCIVSIYLLFDMEYIRNTISKILKGFNKKIYNYIKKIDIELENYLEGMLIFIIIQLFEYSIVFLIIGHPNWFLLALLASLTSVIPYFGGLFTNIIAVILASVISTKLFILTCIVCLVFPNVDAYIISPKIFGKTNNINPIISILITILGAKLFGIVGILFSLPIYIIIKTTLDFYKKDILKSR